MLEKRHGKRVPRLRTLPRIRGPAPRRQDLPPHPVGGDGRRSRRRGGVGVPWDTTIRIPPGTVVTTMATTMATAMITGTTTEPAATSMR